MTEVGTPRNETLIFQTFDRQTANPNAMNPLMSYAVWRGFRELGWGYLWETDTGTGLSYPELATDLVEVLNDDYTHFRFSLREGVYWSDGEELNADDVIYTLDTMFAGVGTLTSGNVNRISNYVKSYEKIDDYTVEVHTNNPAYDFMTVMGVYTWSSSFIIVPEHIFGEMTIEEVAKFNNENTVVLGPYTVSDYDPNGFWQLWELREDWERSAWAELDEDGYMPQYVLYKDFGPEETRSLSFVQNAYDVDTFMSPDSIKAAQARNDAITTFAPTMPYHNMDDACAYGVMMNLQAAPFDMVEVRWALALSLDLQSVGINALNGEFIASPLPMVDTQILRPLYFEPLIPWLEEFELADGYKPFDPEFTNKLADTLSSIGAENIPESTSDFGIGWWKHDIEQAGKLLESVGFTMNDNGNWNLPSGEEWVLELAIPGDWNKVMQRVGFSIADSWRQAGINVNTRQVDSAEFGVVGTVNAERQAFLNWENCVFNPNWLNDWHDVEEQYILPGDSTDPRSGNELQWRNETAFELIEEAEQLPHDSERYFEIGREVLAEAVKDMAYINIMNIPTTIPTNSYYWTGFPKFEDYYAVPYSWWSSAKEMVAAVEPTGN